MPFYRHLILVGILISLSLLGVATLVYPGGSQYNMDTPGFDWAHNYISNLFSHFAVNRIENKARPWAIAGMFVLSLSIVGFFIRFAQKVPRSSAAWIIKYAGIASMIAGFLVVSPWHDEMIVVCSSFALLSLFYITVYLLKSKLHWLKLLSLVSLLTTYACAFVYFTSTHLEVLAVLQKITLAVNLIWVLAVEYGSSAQDFTKKSSS
ncbi:MAG: hypothetical protein AAFN10_18875 [Bacteroidota bacterium]